MANENFIKDFIETVNAYPGYVEIAYAQKGKSNFYKARYVTKLTPEIFREESRAEVNTAFLAGCDTQFISASANDYLRKIRKEGKTSEFDSFEPNKLFYRVGSDSAIQMRNLIGLDCDFKEIFKEFKERTPLKKHKLIKRVFSKFLPIIQGVLGEALWAVIFSGNGIHIYIRLRDSLDCSDSKTYKELYEFLLEYIENLAFGGRKVFDRSCKNTSRLMRLPLSTNWKDRTAPIETEVLYHNHEADGSKLIAKLDSLFRKPKEDISDRSNPPPQQGRDKSHVQKLREALSFKVILEHFNYQKWNSLQNREAGVFYCSSPLKTDSTPSCKIDENKKIYFDFSDWEGGDIFAFISKMLGINCKDNFPKVLEKAEEITGIKKTEKTNYGGSFRVQKGRIVHIKTHSDGGQSSIPLCNFEAQIVAEERRDNGLEVKTLFVIVGSYPGCKSAQAIVPSDRFNSLNWVSENWGCRAIVVSGSGSKDRLREAIQVLSTEVEQTVTYTHIGWRQIDSKWYFLHSGGAIGGEGVTTNISVGIENDRLKLFLLPPPPTGEKLVQAIKASLSIIDVGPHRIMYPALASIYRAPLVAILPADNSLFFSGPSGSYKSEITALLQSHFGKDFDRLSLPGAWSSTATALEQQAFLAKDVIYVVDDFCPRGSTQDVARFHKDADRLFRGQGNRSGRSRGAPDGSLRPTYFSRGLIVSSGEDVPSGVSLRARLLISEVTKNDIRLDKLSICQNYSKQGYFVEAMSAYLKWLAPKMSGLEKTLRARKDYFRSQVRQNLAHSRTPEIVASLSVGLEQFLEFALVSGAISTEEREKYGEDGWNAFQAAALVQSEYQVGEDPAEKFLHLVRAAIVNGQAYLVSAYTGDVLESRDYGVGGTKIGWVKDDEILLEPDTAFALVQRFSRDQNDSISIGKNTLWKRMAQRQLLIISDAEHKNLVRRTVENRRRYVVAISSKIFWDAIENSGTAGPIGPKIKDSGPEVPISPEKIAGRDLQGRILV